MAKIFQDEMRLILFHFNDYRVAAEPKFQENRSLQLKLRDAEIALAAKSPVNEAEYAFDERSPLILYDCLIPKLKEHRKFKAETSNIHTRGCLVTDYEAKAQVLLLQKQIDELKLAEI